jgi:phosphoribosyl-ATP pyrophosphohydrolase
MYELLAVGFCILFYVVVFLNQKTIDQKDRIKELEERDPKNIEKKRLEEAERIKQKEQDIADNSGAV